MKQFFFTMILIAFVLNFGANAQDVTSGSFHSGKSPRQEEVGKETYNERGAFYPKELEDQLKAAQESGDKQTEMLIRKQMDDATPEQYKYRSRPNMTDDVFSEVEVPFNPEWYSTDALVHTGNIRSGSPFFRQVDMKMGEDGWMYMAVNRRDTVGTNGRISIYSSSNGGATWNSVGGVQSASAFYGTVSMLVENRSSSNNPDSTRIFVFYTRSTVLALTDATMNYASVRRDGSAFYTALIADPPAGNTYSFTSAVSDGAFYTSGTWVGVMCTETNNALTTTNNFKYYRSVDWGATWTGVTISTGWNDFYPSAEFKPFTSPSTDSVWIAVERRFAVNDRGIRIIATTWSPSATSNTYFLTSGTQVYEKPVLTVKQNRSTDSVLVTMTKDGTAYYYYTSNGGGSWSPEANLGGASNGNNKLFTWCASSSTGPNAFLGMWVSTDGDSLNVRRGILGNLGTTTFKVNSYQTSTTVSPVGIVYTPTAGENYSAIGYAGLGPLHAYANQEALVIGINPIGNEVPNKFNLEQNYPNPFNPVTNIKFAVPVTGIVKLVVYDVMGREVATLINKSMTAGNYVVDFDASSLGTGVYFYKFTSGEFSETKKMMLVK